MAERLSLQLAFALIALIAAIFYSGKAQFVFNKINQIIHGKRGCSPIVSIGHVTLHYFGFRGRAEGIRFMMEDFEIPYAETNYSKTDWPEIKRKGIDIGLFTFGQGKWQTLKIMFPTSKFVSLALLLCMHCIVHCILGR